MHKALAVKSSALCFRPSRVWRLIKDQKNYVENSEQSVEIPKGVEVTISGQEVSAKGAKGSLTLTLHEDVAITQEESELKLSAVGSTKQAVAMSGTFRSLVKNLVTGVSEGFEKKLELQGVGYRAQAQGRSLICHSGFPTRLFTKFPRVSMLRRRVRLRFW